MRKFSIFSLLFLFAILSNAQSNRTALLSSTIDETVLNFTFESYDFKTVATPRGEASIIFAEELTAILQQGAPDLPKYTESLILPDLAAMQIEILSSKYTDIPNLSIAPSKGNLTRDIDPSTVPYEYGEAYTKDSFFPGGLAALNSPYILRDFRGQALQIFPFQYNPVSKTLRVYSEIKVRIFATVNEGQNIFERTQNFDRLSREFNQIYANHFVNYNTFQARYTPLEEEGNMLIICHDAWTTYMEDFVTWKNTIGRPCEMVTVTDAGGTAANIKTYVENYYNTNGLTYLLLIGDAAQVPTNSGSGLGGDSDNAYGYITGSDHYQELFVGRFSAEDPLHVMTQAERTIEYEMGDQLAAGWLNKLMSVGSSEGGSGQGDDDETDWEHLRNIQTDLLGFTYVGPPYEHFQGSQGGDDAPGDPSPTDVALSLNTGLSIVNYTGHGSDTSWSTSGFSNSNVNSLLNDNKLPFIWSVACVNGNFNGLTCFGEAWMRAENNTEPTGAIGIMASTINQSWAPPMSAQDEMVDLLVGASTNGTKRTFAGLSINGCFLMNDEYSDFAMTDTWTCFGDPSLYVRTDDAANMTVTHNSVIVVGETVFNVTSDLDGALATVSLDGDIIGSAMVSGGNAAIPVSGLVPGTQVTLAVVGFNKVTYIDSVDVIAPSGSYLVVDSYVDAVTFGATTNLDVALKNVGVDDATNVTATISTTDPEASFTNPTYVYGTIAADATSAPSTGAFSLSVADNLPDQYMVEVSLEMTDDTDTWNATKFVTVNAPLFEIGVLSIDDTAGNDDGILDPGETADIIIQTTNAGHADVTNVIGAIVSTSSDLTLNEVTTVPIPLVVGESQSFVFNVTADSGTPEGTPATIDYTVTGGVSSQYSNMHSFELVIGFVPEYCAAGSQSTSDEFIQQVTLMDIDNTSAQGPAYSDYTSVSTIVEQGNSYEITIINGQSWAEDQMGCWVDWNYDGDFSDAGEAFVITYEHNVPSSGLGTGTGTIVVPVDARLGAARMRVRVLYTGGINPCGDTSYGEVEDYTLYVHGPLSTDSYDIGSIGLYPNPNHGSFTLDLSNMRMTDTATIEIINSQGQLLFQSDATDNKMDIKLQEAAGVYFVRITSGNNIINKKLLIN